MKSIACCTLQGLIHSSDGFKDLDTNVVWHYQEKYVEDLGRRP